jgi:hypothetical protein
LLSSADVPRTEVEHAERLQGCDFLNRRSEVRILSGAPRPMKMGTITSPWRYDAIVDHTLEPTYLRWLAILRYAPWTVIVRVRPIQSKASSGVPSGPGFANLGVPFAGPT